VRQSVKGQRSDQLMTIREIAEFLRFSRYQIRRLVRAGSIPYVKAGTSRLSVRFRRADVERWLTANVAKARVSPSSTGVSA
jgi:excisionase family DNA binding protein